MSTPIHGHPPRLEYVSISQIYVDNNYQRELDDKRVKKLAAVFDWRKFGAISLVENGLNKFACVDGQHRLEAATRLGIDRVPASITSTRGIQEEASVFLALNRDRKNVSPVERYWAGLAAEDPLTLRAQKVLTDAGCEVAPAPGIKRPHYTTAVASLMRAVRHYGEQSTRVALTIIRNAWPEDEGALRGIVILTITRLIHNNPEMNRERLERVLRNTNLDELTKGAEALRKLIKGSAERALSKAIAELYNRGISAGFIS